MIVAPIVDVRDALEAGRQEHRFPYIVERPEHAGHATHTIFVGDLDAMVAEIAARPVERETYSNGVRKATCRDPDNELGLGGAPVTPAR